MKFYNRLSELKILRRLYHAASTTATMAVITGRRRIGKTQLALEFSKKRPFVYLFVSKKSEPLLCAEFIEEIRKRFTLPVVGEITRFKDVFALLLELSKSKRFTVIIDEFQEFFTINPSVYSEIQGLWDLHKNTGKLNLVVIGSVYSLIHKIFQDHKEPLFGRADRIITVKPFSVKTITHILADHKISGPKALLDFYTITGGMPKYLDILLREGVKSRNDIFRFILSENSPFLFEGTYLLIEEFGKEYGTYFSVLELIAMGKTSRSEIESVLGKNIGGHLDRLENDYSIITGYKPINAKPNARLLKYRIKDNFLNFWFRFIYRNRPAVETGNFGYIEEVLRRDYAMYSGIMLEKLFHDIFVEKKMYNNIGTYWEKKNNNEIDLVAMNDLKKKVLLAEIKINKSKINIHALKQKSTGLQKQYANYSFEWIGLGIEDLEKHLG